MSRRDAIATAKAAGYRAYQGANGWYAARENADGFHHAPPQHSTLADSAADALAAVGENLANAYDDGDIDGDLPWGQDPLDAEPERE